MLLSPEFSKYLPPFEAVHGRQAAAPNLWGSLCPLPTQLRIVLGSSAQLLRLSMPSVSCQDPA